MAPFALKCTTVVASLILHPAPTQLGRDELASGVVKECGPSCAAIALRWYGKDVRQDELLQLQRSGGCTIGQLQTLMRSHGLDAQLRDVTPEQLQNWDGLAIVHLGPSRRGGDGHFVLFAGDGVAERSRLLESLAPPGPLARMSLDSVEDRWTGCALLLSDKAYGQPWLPIAVVLGTSCVAGYLIAGFRPRGRH